MPPPGARDGGRRPLSNPKCISLWHNSLQSTGSCPLVLFCCRSQPQGPWLLSMRGSPGKPLGKNTKQYSPHPLKQAPRVSVGGIRRKDPGSY